MTRIAILVLAMLGCAIGAVPASARACLVLKRDLHAGDFLETEATKQTPCTGEAPNLPLGFDRYARAPVASARIPAGTYLGPLALVPGRTFAGGERLQLVFRHGPVTIGRDVRLLAPARDGDRALVKTPDGAVLALPLHVDGEDGR